MLALLIIFLVVLKELRSHVVPLIIPLISSQSLKKEKERYFELQAQTKELRRLAHDISAQDEFANWARNDRKLKKNEDQLAEMHQRILTDSSKQLALASGAVTCVTFAFTALMLTLFKTYPVLYLSQGSLLFPLQWLISYPCEHSNAVSTWAFYMACVPTARTLKTFYIEHKKCNSEEGQLKMKKMK